MNTFFILVTLVTWQPSSNISDRLHWILLNRILVVISWIPFAAWTKLISSVALGSQHPIIVALFSVGVFQNLHLLRTLLCFHCYISFAGYIIITCPLLTCTRWLAWVHMNTRTNYLLQCSGTSRNCVNKEDNSYFWHGKSFAPIIWSNWGLMFFNLHNRMCVVNMPSNSGCSIKLY